MPDGSKALSEQNACPEAAGDAEVVRQKISERLRFLFRMAGNNRPALELQQMMLVYRMEDRQP